MRLLTRDEIADGLFNADTVICLQDRIDKLEALALGYIQSLRTLEAENQLLREENAQLSGYDSWAEMQEEGE